MTRPAYPTIGGSTDTWGTDVLAHYDQLYGEIDAKIPFRVDQQANGRWFYSRLLPISARKEGRDWATGKVFYFPVSVPRAGISINAIELVALSSGTAAGAVGWCANDAATQRPTGTITKWGNIADFNGSGPRGVSFTTEVRTGTGAYDLFWVAITVNATAALFSFIVDAGPGIFYAAGANAPVNAFSESHTYNGNFPASVGSLSAEIVNLPDMAFQFAGL
jgi:hypothetical protein